MTAQKSEILVAGTGPAGMIAALGLAHAGFAVTLLGPAPRRDDRRTTALMSPALRYLDTLGVLAGIADHAAPLKVMRIADATSRLVRSPTVTFRASEIGEEFVRPQHAERCAVLGAGRPRCRQRPCDWRQSAVTEWQIGETSVAASLADGSHVEAPLAVAADGRDSLARQAADIATSARSYPQSALVLNFAHSREHGFISTEFHTETGPFTQVPLPGNRSSLVWVVKPETAEELAALDDAALVRPRRSRRCSRCSAASPSSPAGRSIRSRRCCPRASPRTGSRWSARQRMYFRRSAHKASTSASATSRTSCAPPRSIATIRAAPAALAAYDRRRRPDILARSTAVNLLNVSLLSDMLPAQLARSAGLGVLGALAPLRAFFMREGMQPGSGFARAVSSLREQVRR